ncbi:MAG: carboxypeptidase-like regulatory domain-containing protein, partial [Candidatus Dojkabacteria bacterium]|nr:carboxypeptidase-like regulatory domain-containing protein [Candidatus Dojkabacteria bacterium]
IEIIDRTVDDINEALDKTVGQLDPVDLERVTTTTSIITLTTATLITIGTLLNLPYFLLQFILNLLSWFGLRGGAKPLGYVYDALTKDPISQAIVRIFNTENKIVWSDVTNGKGYFSARLEPGKYKIVVRAVDYTFPSTIIFGREDYPLTNVYHGEQFEHRENEDLNFSIPLDPNEVSDFRVWREILWGRIKNIVNILHIILFIIGLVLATYMYSKNPYWLTTLVLILYIPSFFLTLRNIFGRRDRYGNVRDIDGKPVEGVVVGLREKEFDKVKIKRVTDRHGRYRIFVDRGNYTLEILDTSFKVEEIEGGSGIEFKKNEQWITKDIIVSRLEKS